MDDYENPLPGKIYISPSLTSFDDPGRKIRIATKLLEQPDSYAYAHEKGELVLRHKAGAKTTIKAKFFEDDRGLSVLSVQGYTIATLKPHNGSFSFVGEEIGKLVAFLNHVQSMPLKTNGPMVIPDEHLQRLVVSNVQAARTLFHDNEELFAEVLRSEVTKQDVVAVGYRKRQLQAFKRLLEDDTYFASAKAQKQCTNEAVWQQYFEKNPWIFGYGLSYIPLSSLTDKKLEQVVHGYTVADHGKRVDALLRTRGVISSLCFVEIKTHETDLLQSRPYRSGCWAASDELVGGVSQVQGTVEMAADSIRTKLSIHDALGNPTGEEAFSYLPKSFLVIGSLKQFVTESGVNQERYRSFELFRRNTASPEIITFDELYERARYIVQQQEA
jgi:Domain of unknown function (DUF4263)